MVGLLHAMAFMVLLLIGWVIWNNIPLPLPFLLSWYLAMCQIFCCSIIQGVSLNYHQRNMRSRVSVSNFQVSVSAFMTKCRSRLKIWARSRSRRLRSRLHHCIVGMLLCFVVLSGIAICASCVGCLFHGWPTCLRLGSTRKFFDNPRSTSW